jgi:hypothetical protein
MTPELVAFADSLVSASLSGEVESAPSPDRLNFMSGLLSNGAISVTID